MAVQQYTYLDPLFVSRLKNIEIKARMIVEGFITGLHKSPYHGFSVEFAEHRPFNTGESLKSIDWKVYGKTDKLYSKKFEEETNMRCHVVLDVSDSMRYPRLPGQVLTKLEYGCYLAASLAYLMVSQKDAAGLTLFDEQIQYFVPPKAKHSWLFPIYKKLEETVASQQDFSHKTATPTVLHQLAKKFSRRGFIVLITDLFYNLNGPDELFPALQHLRHARHEVIIFHLLHRETEDQFHFSNQPLILKDLETGEELRVQPQQIQSHYVELMNAYKANLLKRCRELQVDFIEVDITKSYDKALLDYVIKRKMLTK